MFYTEKKMGKTKKLAFVLVLTLVMGLLTACGGSAYGIQMNANGSGKLAYSIMFEKALYKYLGTDVTKKLDSLSDYKFEKVEITVDGEDYIAYKKEVAFQNTGELKKMLTSQKTFAAKFLGGMATDEIPEELILFKSCVITAKTFQAVVPASELLDRDMNTVEGNPLANLFTRISITFDNTVVDTNGKTSDDGKTVSWMVKESLNDTILLASTGAKPLYTKDTEKPVVVGVKNNGYYNSGFETVVIKDNVGVASAKVNGKMMSNNEEYFENDARYIITAKDFAGNTTKVTFYIDTKAPVVKGATHGRHYNAAKTISFSDERGIKSATLDGKTVKSGTKVTSSGLHKLRVKDLAGNVTYVDFFIDKKAPTVKGVANGKTYYSAKKITFSDNGKIKSATLNGKAIKSGKTVSNAGRYTLKVTDKAGNVKTVKFTMK